MKIVSAYQKEPDDEILEIAIVGYAEAIKLLTYKEDKKILKYVFNK